MIMPRWKNVLRSCHYETRTDNEAFNELAYLLTNETAKQWRQPHGFIQPPRRGGELPLKQSYSPLEKDHQLPPSGEYLF